MQQKEFQIQHRTRSGLKSTKYIINIKKGSKNNDNIILTLFIKQL